MTELKLPIKQADYVVPVLTGTWLDYAFGARSVEGELRNIGFITSSVMIGGGGNTCKTLLSRYMAQCFAKSKNIFDPTIILSDPEASSMWTEYDWGCDVIANTRPTQKLQKQQKLLECFENRIVVSEGDPSKEDHIDTVMFDAMSINDNFSSLVSEHPINSREAYHLASKHHVGDSSTNISSMRDGGNKSEWFLKSANKSIYRLTTCHLSNPVNMRSDQSIMSSPRLKVPEKATYLHNNLVTLVPQDVPENTDHRYIRVTCNRNKHGMSGYLGKFMFNRDPKGLKEWMINFGYLAEYSEAQDTMTVKLPGFEELCAEDIRGQHRAIMYYLACYRVMVATKHPFVDDLSESGFMDFVMGHPYSGYMHKRPTGHDIDQPCSAEALLKEYRDTLSRKD